MRRRAFLSKMAGLCVAAQHGCLNHAYAEVGPIEKSLRNRARAKGVLFGCAVSSPLLRKDAAFADAIARDADILVHEYELKRKNVEPEENVWTFEGSDQVLQFALQHDQKIRGHTLCWHVANPAWLEQSLSDETSVGGREKLLVDYIQRVVGRYGPNMHSWDVVNEPIEPEDWDFNDMRTTSPWFRALGEDYIDIAFAATKQLSGDALLMINDYSVESDANWNERRRTVTLQLLERLIRRGVPVSGFGIQGHLKPYREKFNERVFSKFLDELQSLGLKIMITEFDVTDVDGPDDPAKRDADLAAVTRSFFDVSLASDAVIGMLTWGISDRYSWLSDNPSYKRSDGTKSRVLPYDVEMKKKPMWHAIAAALDAAPVRPAHGASTP